MRARELTPPLAAWGPTLTGRLVQVSPIHPPRARVFLASVPDDELPWEEGFPLPPVRAVLKTIVAADVVLGPFLAYVIVRRADGRAIGDAGFHGPPGPGRTLEIGYAVVPAARCRGAATEAVALLTEWALAQPMVERVIARVDRDNVASRRVLQRCWFRPDGAIRGKPCFTRSRQPPPLPSPHPPRKR
jgi:RimJ/RimL family protein N-acetyltransferase